MSSNIKLSVVTSYYNRRSQFLKTIESINRSKYKNDIEIVVVDDASNIENNIENIPTIFPDLKFKLLMIKPEEKYWKNSCVPFNKAIKLAEGEIILLQNPENYHATDIISHAIENLKYEDYFVYKTFALTKEWSDDINFTIKNINFESIHGAGEGKWYIHPTHRPYHYHFATAIYANVLQKELNGFDERFAMGKDWEDSDLVQRIEHRKLNIQIIEDHLVLHQWHEKDGPFAQTTRSNYELALLVKQEGKIKAN